MSAPNALHSFMATCFAQAAGVVQEPAQINGATVMGTFGDPQMIPVMTRYGSQDHLVTTLQVARAAFADAPAAHSKVVRPATGREYFVQIVDHTHPTVFTFLLTDRDL